jgi:serine/threonine protein kinase
MSSIHDKIQKHSPLVKAGSSGGKRDPNISAADIEFSSHVVVVLKKMGEFGTSHFYSAKDDDSLTSKKIWRGSPIVERSLLIKATTASTSDEIRRAEKEVKLLRKLRDHGSIPKLIDCGFSTFAEDGRSSKNPEAQSGSAKRLYCMLFEWCPDYLLSDFIALQRRKLDQAKPIRGFLGKFARKSDSQDPGYLSISTVLNIFEQMCEGVKALHTLKKNDPNSKKCGILHLDITPGRFMMRNLSMSTVSRESQSNFKVKLCSFGCAITGTLPLRNDLERKAALQMLKVVTTDIYRAPEMVNLQLSEELTGR